LSIASPLGRSRKLPIDTGDTRILRVVSDEVKLLLVNRQFDQAEWHILWLFHLAATSATVYERRYDWKNASEVYLCLIRVCDDIPHCGEYVNRAKARMNLFGELVCAILRGQSTRAITKSATHSLESSPEVLVVPDEVTRVCPAMARRMEEAFGELSTWTAESLAESSSSRNELLLKAVAEGKVLVVESLLHDRSKIDVETLDDSNRTQLIHASISGYATITALLCRQVQTLITWMSMDVLPYTTGA